MNSELLWFTTRSTGIVAFCLFTLTFALGIVATQKAMASPRWPRFATQALHRNASLLGLLFLFVHIVTTVVDTYVNVGWLAVVVPLTSDYQRWEVALGTLAFDCLVVLIVSSLLRSRLPARTWRALHWLAYAMWPLSFLHFLENGTDTAHGRFGLWIAWPTFVVVVAAVVVRLVGSRDHAGPVRSLQGATR